MTPSHTGVLSVSFFSLSLKIQNINMCITLFKEYISTVKRNSPARCKFYRYICIFFFFFEIPQIATFESIYMLVNPSLIYKIDRACGHPPQADLGLRDQFLGGRDPDFLPIMQGVEK